jgi:hypothetical protein
MNNSIKRSLLLGAAVGVLCTAASFGSLAQYGAPASGQDLVGSWKLVSDSNTGSDGVKRSSAFGENPMGLLIFTSDGHYSSINTRGDLPKFVSGNRMQGTTDENKAIVQGSIAHFGRYKVSEDGKAMMLTPEAGTWPAWIGKEQKRDFDVVGDKLTYRVNASIGGVSELTYKRMK